MLTGLRYIFLKNELNLTEKQKLKKQEIYKLGLYSWGAMLIKECFQDIYNASLSEEFEMLLKRWYYWATHSKQLNMLLRPLNVIGMVYYIGKIHRLIMG